MRRFWLGVSLAAAALGGATLALAESEDSLLRRFPYDPACAWGRIGNGKGMVVRCLSEEEATRLRATPAASGAPAASSAGVGFAAPPVGAASASAAVVEPPPAAEPGSEQKLDVVVGPVTADEGVLGVGKLGAPKEKYVACVQKFGGLKEKAGEVHVRFLVRGKGIAEGVSVAKRLGVSKEAGQCVAEVVDRRRVGTPSAPLVGATVVIRFTRADQ